MEVSKAKKSSDLKSGLMLIDTNGSKEATCRKRLKIRSSYF